MLTQDVRRGWNWTRNRPSGGHYCVRICTAEGWISISAVFNLGRREFNLVWAANPFERMPIQKEGQDAEKRLPFTHDELATISLALLEGKR